MWKCCLIFLIIFSLQMRSNGFSLLGKDPNDWRLFEFGLDEGNLAFVTQGHISVFEKIKRVPINIPDCQLITHISVDIGETRVTPNVRYDKKRQEVTIEYGLFQNARSTYEIRAKAIDDPKCGNKVTSQNLDGLLSSLGQTYQTGSQSNNLLPYYSSIDGNNRPSYVQQAPLLDSSLGDILISSLNTGKVPIYSYTPKQTATGETDIIILEARIPNSQYLKESPDRDNRDYVNY